MNDSPRKIPPSGVLSYLPEVPRGPPRLDDIYAQPSLIDVELHLAPSGDRDLIQKLEAPTDQRGNIPAASLLEKIKEKGFPVNSCIVSYFSPAENMYVFLGRDPVAASPVIPRSEIQQNRLILRCRAPSFAPSPTPRF